MYNQFVHFQQYRTTDVLICCCFFEVVNLQWFIHSSKTAKVMPDYKLRNILVSSDTGYTIYYECHCTSIKQEVHSFNRYNVTLIESRKCIKGIVSPLVESVNKDVLMRGLKETGGKDVLTCSRSLRSLARGRMVRCTRQKTPSQVSRSKVN